MATATERANFIKKIGPLIQKEARDRGYKVCSPAISQAIFESNWGQSILAAKYHNYHGLKCGSYWKGPSVNMGTKEEYNGNLCSIRDNFRVFSSMEMGVKGYYDFLNTKRYDKLKYCNSAREYAEEIKKAGFATSSSYVNTIMKYINEYGLAEYDGYINPYRLSTTLLVRGSKGESVKWLQFVLNMHGANLQIDGIYGPKTELAVCLYQKDHGLVTDGKAGPVTLLSLKNNQ